MNKIGALALICGSLLAVGCVQVDMPAAQKPLCDTPQISLKVGSITKTQDDLESNKTSDSYVTSAIQEVGCFALEGEPKEQHYDTNITYSIVKDVTDIKEDGKNNKIETNTETNITATVELILQDSKSIKKQKGISKTKIKAQEFLGIGGKIKVDEKLKENLIKEATRSAVKGLVTK